MPDKILSVAGNSFATTNQSQNAICVGDKISLFVEDFNGFVSADGFTDNSLSVMCLRQDEICVPRFESCVFQVRPAEPVLCMLPLLSAPLSPRTRRETRLLDGLWKTFQGPCSVIYALPRLSAAGHATENPHRDRWK